MTSIRSPRHLPGAAIQIRIAAARGRSLALAGLVAIVLAACADETVSGYAAEGPWRLVELDGAPVPEGVTMRFPSRGVVAGEFPCNDWRAQQTAPYPWFLLSHFETGSETCPGIDLERRAVHALASMTLAEAQGDVLILSNDDGSEMVFRRPQPR